VLGFGKLRDVIAGVLESDELAAARQRVSDFRIAVSSRYQPKSIRCGVSKYSGVGAN
jgi:hypothetical protein